MDGETLINAIQDDSKWSDGTELDRLADLYWTKRQAHDDDGAKAIWAQMNEIPEKREKIDKGDHLIYRLSYGDARYEFDSMLCPIGWLQFDTSQDAWYFGVWVNPEKRMIVTYAEGDLSLEVCNDISAYNAAIKRCVDFYEEGQICVVFDLEAKTHTKYVQDRAEFFVPVS